jgi:uncharacterized membrane protein YcaP (DUF421 family)
MISQFNFFDFASAVTIGALTTQVAIPTKEWPRAAVVIVIFTTLTVLLDFSIQKWPKLRSFVNSKPKMVIYKGQIDAHELRKARLTLDELLTILRQKDVFHIGDVHCAVLETDGKLSVLLHSDKLPVTLSDLNLHPPDRGMTNDVIKDGAIVADNLRHSGHDEAWLRRKLREQGVERIEDVFYAGVDAQGEVYVSTRENLVVDSDNKYIQ